MMKVKIVALSLLVTAVQIAAPITNVAQAEDCPTYNLSQIFDEEYYPNLKWDNSSGNRIIKWSTNVDIVNNVKIARPFSTDEDAWLVASFNAWDQALDSIKFQRVTDPTQADVLVGFTPIKNSGYWTIEKDDNNPNIRKKGTVQISSSTPVALEKNGFITIALSEIGNLMGLGDIKHAGTPHSVLFDPDQAPFGELPLADFDIDMIRQFYGESTCHSSWGAELKQAKADKAAAEKKAQDDANAAATAKAQAEAQAAADKAAAEKKAQEDALRAQLASGKKKSVTITCVKGKVIKKVSGTSPKCPTGYKKK